MAAGAYGLGMTASVLRRSRCGGASSIGIGYSVVLGLIMGVPTLRLRADYLAIVTIAAAEIVRLVRAIGQVQAMRSAAPTACKGFASAFQQVGVDLGLAARPGRTASGRSQFSGRRPVGR